MKKKEIKVPECPEKNPVNGTIVYEVVIGDHGKGIDTEDSPFKVRGVYVARKSDVFNCKVKPVVVVDQVYKYYEIAHFMQLVMHNEVEAMEMLFVPDTFKIISYKYFTSIVRIAKMSYLRNGFGYNVLRKIEEAIGYINIPLEKLGDFSVKFKKFLKLDIKNYCAVVGNNSFFETPKTFNQFVNFHSSFGRKEKNFLLYPAIPGIDNLYYITYDEDADLKQGFFDVEENIIVQKLNNVKQPLGLLIIDRKDYERNRVRLLDKYGPDEIEILKQEGWRVAQDDVDGDIVYNPNVMAEVMLLANTAIEYFDTYNFRINRSSESEYYHNIKKGKYSLKDVVFDLLEKRNSIRKVLDDSRLSSVVPERFIENKVNEIRKEIYAKETTLSKHWTY